MSDEQCMAEAIKDILKHAKTGTLINIFIYYIFFNYLKTFIFIKTCF